MGSLARGAWRDGRVAVLAVENSKFPTLINTATTNYTLHCHMVLNNRLCVSLRFLSRVR